MKSSPRLAVRRCPVPARPPFAAAVAAAFLQMALASSDVNAQTISRGNQLLMQRGLQIQAMAHGALNPTVFQQSNFTTVFKDNLNVETLPSLGPPPGIQWGRLYYTASRYNLDSSEVPYKSNLVGLQLNDELDISDQAVLDQARAVLNYWRFAYPDTIGYLNQYGNQNTTAQLQNYLSYVQPDMLMMDYYPFNGSLADGSPTIYYTDLQKYRQLGLGGVDGTGQLPIPTGLYLQAFTDPAHFHIPSASETRVNQFSAWTFGYKYVTALTYSGSSANGTGSTLFIGDGDGTPRQPQFSDMAETNRQSRNLGPALVQLQTTDVAMIMGLHKLGSFDVTNTQPGNIPLWAAGAGGDPYLTDVSATNIGGSNSGLPGDVVIGHFRPLQGAGDNYFMVLNGLSIPTGTVADAAQIVHLTFNFGASGIDSLERLSRTTGLVEVVPLVPLGASLYHLDLTLDGGTADLFKYRGGLAFVGVASGDLNLDGVVDLADYAILKSYWLQTTSGGVAAGDLNTDGTVDFADFALFKQDYIVANGGNGSELSPIPEPGALGLAAVGMLCLAFARTWRSRLVRSLLSARGLRWRSLLMRSHIGAAWLSLCFCLRFDAVGAAESPDPGVTAVDFVTREVYRAKTKPAYTSWVSFFPGHEGEWYLSFEEVHKVEPPLPVAALDDWYRFILPDGYDKSPYKMEVVLLRSDDQCATWKEVSRQPARFQHSAGSFGQIRTRDGRFLRSMWNCYKLDGQREPGRFLYESSDDGKTWTNLPPLLSDRFCAYPHRMKQLRDGTIVLAVPYGLMWGADREHPTRVSRMSEETGFFAMSLFVSRNEGRDWEGPIPIFPVRDVSETDFVELPSGDLLAIVSAAFERPGRQIIYRVGERFVPGPFLALEREPGLNPPECITLATDGLLIGCYRTAHYLWSDDLGKRWHRLSGAENTRYQPMIHQLPDGRIACAWHQGYDDPIAGANQYIGMDFFRVRVNEKRAETRLRLIRKFDAAANQFTNTVTVTLTADGKPLAGKTVQVWCGASADRRRDSGATAKATTGADGRVDVRLPGIGSEGQFEVLAHFNEDGSDKGYQPADSAVCLFYAVSHGNGGKQIGKDTPQ